MEIASIDYVIVNGPDSQYTHWLLFAYCGGSVVLGGHPVGVMNWVSLIVVGIFTVDMVIKTWICAFRPNGIIDMLMNK